MSYESDSHLPALHDNVAVACDVRLGEMVARNPDIASISVDPAAVAEVLHRLQPEGAPQQNILFIASHDDSFEKAQHSAPAQDAQKEVAEPITVVVPVGGGEAVFRDKFLLDTVLGGPYSYADRLVDEYAEQRGLSSEEVYADITTYISSLAYLNPTPRTTLHIQHYAVEQLIEATEGAVTVPTIRQRVVKDLMCLAGYPVSAIAGANVASAIESEPPAGILGAMAGFVLWSVFEKFQANKDTARQVHAERVNRIEEIAHSKSMPAIVSILPNK
jgi:hypothetical protein